MFPEANKTRMAASSLATTAECSLATKLALVERGKKGFSYKTKICFKLCRK